MIGRGDTGIVAPSTWTRRRESNWTLVKPSDDANPQKPRNSAGVEGSSLLAGHVGIALFFRKCGQSVGKVWANSDAAAEGLREGEAGSASFRVARRAATYTRPMRFWRARSQDRGDESLPKSHPLEVLWRPEQYNGEASVAVAATQLDDKIASPAERRRVYAEWIEFFATADTNISRLDLRSRVPQELLDSISGQRQLNSIHVEWGPYRDITALVSLPALNDIALGGATALESLNPLRDLSQISTLFVSQSVKPQDVV